MLYQVKFFPIKKKNLKKFFIGVQLPYNVVLVSSVWKGESTIHTHISPLFLISFPFRSAQSTKIAFPVLCIILFIRQLSIFGCTGSSLLHMDFLQPRRTGATLDCSTQASHCGGFSCCRAWVPGQSSFSSCGSWAQQSWSTGLVVLHHVESSQTRDQTRVQWIIFKN